MMLQRKVRSWMIFLCAVTLGCKNPKNELPVAQAKVDTFIRHMNMEVQRYRSAELYDSASVYLNYVGDTVRKLNNDRLTLRWSIQKVQEFSVGNQIDSATFYMNIALPLLGAKNISYKDSFNLYLIQQNLIKKQDLYDSALHVGNELYYLALRNDSFKISTVSVELAQLYMIVDDLPNLRKYMLEAWKFKDKEPELIGDVAKLIMVYYDKIHNIDSAIYYLQVLQKNPGRWSNQPAAIASLNENTGLFLMEKGKLKEGLQHILMAKRFVNSMGIKDSRFYNNLADAYGKVAQFATAFMYADSAIAIALEQKEYELLQLAWRTKSELFLKKSQFRLAYDALDSSFAYYGTQMDSSLRMHGREVETQYAVREKDAKIKALALTNAANLKVSRQQRVTIISLIVAAILATVSGVLLWKRRQVQIKVREADLRQQLLRAQMEPHFLFNMLSLLQALIRANDQEKSVLLLNKFSRLLRSILENGRKRFVLLSDEIAVLESYLILQSMLLEEKFDYQVEVDNSIQQDSVLIPPMLLQPFAENAIQHGFHNLGHKGSLLIQIKHLDGSLICTIDDDGIGMQQPPLKDGRFHSSEITKERLTILAKQIRSKTKLKITNKESVNGGQGVRVEIEVPYVPAA